MAKEQKRSDEITPRIYRLEFNPNGVSQWIACANSSEATTPGGVTEAILRGIELGERLPVALERGIKRSRELAAA
jgi:hypothetical protein